MSVRASIWRFSYWSAYELRCSDGRSSFSSHDKALIGTTLPGHGCYSRAGAWWELGLRDLGTGGFLGLRQRAGVVEKDAVGDECQAAAEHVHAQGCPRSARPALPHEKTKDECYQPWHHEEDEHAESKRSVPCESDRKSDRCRSRRQREDHEGREAQVRVFPSYLGV